MHSIENNKQINDLNIQNGTNSRSEEFPQYSEYTQQKEYHQFKERSFVNEMGMTEELKPKKEKNSSQEKSLKIANVLRKVISAFAVVIVAAVVAPDIVPILSTASPEIYYAYVDVQEESISYSIGVEGYIEGDELSVIVYNDFFKDENIEKSKEIYGYVEGLKPNMRYKIQVECAGKVILQKTLITGSGQNIEMSSSSSSPEQSHP